MKKLFLLLIVGMLSLCAEAQVSTSQFANSSTGTTLNTLTKIVVNGGVPQAQIAATTDTSGVIGVATSPTATAGQATITYSGIAPVVFDNATTAGDYCQISATVAGNCHDVGATRPTLGQIIGIVAQTGGSAGTYFVLLDKSILPTSGSVGGNLFGDGSDGAVTADGSTTVTCLGAPTSSTYTMTRDCYFTTLTVNSGVTIKTVSNRILAATSITSTGTIQNAGNAGGNGGNATGTNKATGGTAGSLPSALAAGSLAAPVSSKAGLTGGSGGTGVGSSGTNGATGNTGQFALTSSSGNAGVAGGNGGASGASGGNNAGGTGGTAGSGGPSSPVDHYSPHEVSVAKNLYDPAANALQVSGGNGSGGSGAAGGGDATNSGGGGGGSGGGG
jgi:hypothetical protein